MGKLIIPEPPMQLLPTLAVRIGDRPALFVQQLHYWITLSKQTHDKKKWVYNTIDDWHKQFPFWSQRTLRRIIASLEERGILLTGNFNRKNYDKTKWYTLDYSHECFRTTGLKTPDTSVTFQKGSPCGQNDQRVSEKASGQNDKAYGQNGHTNTSRLHTETTYVVGKPTTDGADIDVQDGSYFAVCSALMDQPALDGEAEFDRLTRLFFELAELTGLGLRRLNRLHIRNEILSMTQEDDVPCDDVIKAMAYLMSKTNLDKGRYAVRVHKATQFNTDKVNQLLAKVDDLERQSGGGNGIGGGKRI
jgi:hypothetical protein